ncbi:acetyltransferase [Myroides odoratimimus]|nr:acetyltransferase [Myroides odoratimimus]MDM1053326.1 acetyltransferase [Myroides odoratimimus]
MQNNMKKIIIIGAGGNAIEIDEYIAFNNLDKKEYEVLGVIDDNEESYSRYRFSAPYLGKIKDHQVEEGIFYVIAIANTLFKIPIVNTFLEKNAQFINIIHRTAYISPSAKLGIGVVIAPFVNLGPNTEIGDFTLVNSRSSIGHDTKLGKFNFIAPNVSFSGNTIIGSENLFGVSSATIPGIIVGDRNKIAAGMILDKNVGNDSVVFHKFKEKILTVLK